MRNVRVAMTIAGSDSIGGAGIQADLKTFAAFGVYGTSAITAVTAQNTFGVTKSMVMPGDMVYEQIRVVAEDSGVDAAKTGMLGNAEVIEAVAKAVDDFGFPLVVDPVMVAKSGARLLDRDAVEVLKEKLIPRATLVTPNLDEVRELVGVEVHGVEDMERVARAVAEETGCRAVLVKGGHLTGDRAVDVLYDGRVFHRFESPAHLGCFHGTGCSLSSAIAANLALGRDLLDAVKTAKEFIIAGIRYAVKAGRNCDSVNAAAIMERDAIAWRMLAEMREAVSELLKLEGLERLIPEVGMNLAYAMPPVYAKAEGDVIAIEGRITRGVRGPVCSERFEFGASRHLARAVLTYMRFFPDYRSVINVRFDEDLVELLSGRFVVSSYDRRDEPEDIRRREGATIPWGVESAIRRAGRRPDAVFHRGDVGKEPMVLLFGRSPAEVVNAVAEILSEY